MKRTIALAVAGTGLLGLGAAIAPQAAYAYPTCEQEVNIRCHGHSVGNHPRLDIYYNSPEECVAAETPAECGHDAYAGQSSRLQDVLDRQTRALIAKG